MAKRILKKENVVEETLETPVVEEVVETVPVEEKPVVVEQPKKKIFGKVSNCISLNLRSGASKNTAVIDELAVNTKLEIVDDASIDFYKVVAPNNKIGYVMKNFVTKIAE